MAVPKRRVCPSRKGMRKSHQALKVPGMSLDKKTKINADAIGSGCHGWR
jgi:ribosomal protein L32